ncbi:MAG: hypothetical protein K1X71_10445 [Pirellulales bacterium]|jgi:hypothetical protein|nr:hypothetical protein [Pirellulales bacterium]
MNEPLILDGELIVTEDGSVVVGREELASAIYEWCHGRLDQARVTIEEVEE